MTKIIRYNIQKLQEDSLEVLLKFRSMNHIYKVNIIAGTPESALRAAGFLGIKSDKINIITTEDDARAAIVEDPIQLFIESADTDGPEIARIRYFLLATYNQGTFIKRDNVKIFQGNMTSLLNEMFNKINSSDFKYLTLQEINSNLKKWTHRTHPNLTFDVINKNGERYVIPCNSMTAQIMILCKFL